VACGSTGLQRTAGKPESGGLSSCSGLAGGCAFHDDAIFFAGAHAWASGPNGPIGKVEKLGILQKAQARWHAWREERERAA